MAKLKIYSPEELENLNTITNLFNMIEDALEEKNAKYGCVRSFEVGSFTNRAYLVLYDRNQTSIHYADFNISCPLSNVEAVREAALTIVDILKKDPREAEIDELEKKLKALKGE